MKTGLPSQLRPVALSAMSALCLWHSELRAGEPIQIVAPVESSSSVFETGDVPQGEFTGTYEVIEQEDLQQTGSSLAEIVAESSGVQFRQSGGVGSFSTVSLRGSTAEQVNVYLDGILLNQAAGGGVNLSHIELMQADRVEVFRGAIPVQLGNSAIGGAVNITSNRATANPSGRMFLGFGSFGTSKLSASYAGPVSLQDTSVVNESRLVASFTHRKSNNDFVFLNDNGTELNPDDDSEERRNNAGTESLSGFLKSGFTFNGRSRFEQVVQLDSNTQGIADWTNSAQGDATLTSDSVQWRASVIRKSADWSSKWGLHFSTKDEVFDNSSGSIGLGLQKIQSGTRVFGGSVFSERVDSRQSLSLNVKGRFESLDSNNLLSEGAMTSAERTRADVNLQWSRFYADGENLFSFGLFGFAVSDDYRNAAAGTNNYSAETVLPQIGLNHSLGKFWGGSSKLIANAAVQKRVPSFFELFGNQGIFTGNESLKTETSRNVDIGVEWTSAATAKADTSLQLVWFYSRKNDLIARVYDARGVGRSENISAARGAGVELSGLVALDSGFELDTSLTIQDAENRSNVRESRGRQVPGEAALDGALSLRWRDPSWLMEYTYKVSRDRFYDSPNNLRAADQHIHSVRVSRTFAPWSVAVELNNIGNHNYEDFNGYPKPGRSGFISLFYKP